MKLPAPSRDLGVCAVAYIVALTVAIGVTLPLSFAGPLERAVIGDLVATLVIFAFSWRLDNSSMYDAYWSVAPVPILAFWMLAAPTPPGPVHWILFALVLTWSVRLTWNWLLGWRGLSHEDWRYVNLRNEHGSRYWLVSFLGLHMMPTVLVFLGCLPLFSVVFFGTSHIGVGTAIAALVTGGAVLIEGIADRRLRAFRNSNAGSVSLDTGLWARSRHPNYFGEVLFWWGLLAFGLVAVDALPWWSRIGAPAITGLFLFVSIPMMERRMIQRRPGYAARRAQVPALVPWRRRPLKDANRH